MKTCNRPSPITESSFIVPRWIPWIGLALCVAVVVWVLGTCSDSPSLVSYAPPEPHIKGKTIKEENNAPPTEQRENRVTLEPTRLADGCWHVYLDVGSNIGVQVRKLFEPQLYPNATFLNVFSTRFNLRIQPMPIAPASSSFPQRSYRTFAPLDGNQIRVTQRVCWHCRRHTIAKDGKRSSSQKQRWG